MDKLMSYLRRAFLGFAFGVGGMVLLSVPAQAQNSIIGTVIQGQSGGTPIGGAVGVNCSTNVTCSIVAGILQVSVSGSLFCAPVGSPTANAVLFDNGSGCPADATKSATIPGLAVVSGGLNFQGNISQAAWTTNGLRLTSTPATLTDTSSSGTVAAAYTNVLGGNTIAATMATTYTNYYNTYFNAPSAGANVTMTNKWALGADSLNVAGLAQAITGTFSGRLTDSYTSIASTPAGLFSGTWYTGGSSTTTKPHLLVECNSGTTTSTAWSTNGTGLGVNACSGFTGNLLDLQVNGGSNFKVAFSGAVTGATLNLASTGYIQIGVKGVLVSPADGIWQMWNAAENNFTRLDLGGTTSGFGAIGVTNQTNPIINIVDAAGGSTAQLAIPYIQSTTGQRFVCITTTGILVSSATACVGT